MNLDIRLPIGALFTLIGLLLTGFGLASDPALYERSLGTNVNLAWGIVVLAFGVAMLLLGRRGTSQPTLAEEDPEGREIEQREHAEGLERENS